MKPASVVGILLIFLAIVSLAYFVSPVRLFFHGAGPVEPARFHPMPLILGASALVAGVLLLFAAGAGKKKSER